MVVGRPLGGVEFGEGVVVDGGFVGTVVAESFAGAGVEVRGAGVGGGGVGRWFEEGGGVMGIGSVPFWWRGVIGGGVGVDRKGKLRGLWWVDLVRSGPDEGGGRRCNWEG